MTPKEFAKFLKRDLGCFHCGSDVDLIPQHRLNRGAGGKNAKADKPSNVIVFCALANGLLESDAEFAQHGRVLGWKLSSWQEPSETPVFDKSKSVWVLLDDVFGRIELHNYVPDDVLK